MGKTHRHEPRDGQFKHLRGNKKRRLKDRQKSKAILTKYVQLTNRELEWDDET